MANFWDNLNNQAAQRASQGAPQSWDEYSRLLAAQTPQPTKKKGFWEDQISTGGSIGGALAGSAMGAAAGSAVPVVGTAVGGILGALLGGAFGGGAGEMTENAIQGDGLWDNVGKEAALNGVFGAGPIRLGSLVARTGMGLAKGAGKEALAQAGAKAITDTPIRTLLGKSATESSKNLAIRPLGLAKGQKTSVRNLGRGSVADISERFGIKDVSGIEKALADGNRRYGQIVDAVPAISKSEIQDSLTRAIAKLSSSKSTGQLKNAKALQAEADSLVGRLPNSISGKEFNLIKREYDDLVSEAGQLADPAIQGVNKRIANALRGTIQKASGSDELKNLGLDLRALKKLQDVANKNLESGTSKSGLRLSDLMFGAGALVNPAALTGIAATRALGSNTTARAASGLLGKSASKLNASAGKSSLPRDSVRNIGLAGALNGSVNQSALESPLNQPYTNNTAASTSPETPMNATALPNSSNMAQQYTQTQEQSSPLGYSSAQIAQALMQALAANDTASAKQLSSMYELASTFEASAAKSQAAPKLSQAQQERQDLITALDNTESIMAGGSVDYGPVGGSINDIKAIFNAADPETLAYKNTIQGMRAAITKARAGASLTDGELKMLEQYTPGYTDSEQVVRSKLAALRQLYGYTVPNIGGGEADLLSALQSGM